MQILHKDSGVVLEKNIMEQRLKAQSKDAVVFLFFHQIPIIHSPLSERLPGQGIQKADL